MCYSAESSGGTFLFVAFIAFLLMIQGKTAIALILVVLAFMQVLEYIIWMETPACTTANYVASSLIPLVLSLQPLLLSLILWQFNAGYASPHLYQSLFYVLCGAFFCMLVYVLRHKRGGCVGLAQSLGPKGCVGPKGSGSGHLDWGLDSTFFSAFKPSYFAVMAFLILSLRPAVLGISLFSLYSLSWFYYSYWYPTEWPSLWCHSINAGSVVALLAA